MAFNINKLFNANARYAITSVLSNLSNNRTVVYVQSKTGKYSTVGVHRSQYDRPFIVGFIPPDIAINYTPVSVDKGQILSASQVTVKPDVKVVTVPDANKSGSISDGTEKDKMGNLKSKTPEDWEHFVKFCDSINAPYDSAVTVLIHESEGLDTGAIGNLGTENEVKGLNQLTKDNYARLARANPSFGLDPNGWDSYQKASFKQQLDMAAAYFKGSGVKKWESSGQMMAVQIKPNDAKDSSDLNHVLYTKGEPGYKGQANMDHNKDGILTVGDLQDFLQEKNTRERSYAMEQINAARERLKSGTGVTQTSSSSDYSQAGIVDSTKSTTTGPDDETVVQSVGIMTGGASITSGSETGDPYSQLGRHISIDLDREAWYAQRIREELNEAIKTIIDTPALMMFVNPKNFNRHFENTNDYAGGWRGQIVSAWLEKPLKLSSSGTTAAQYAMEADGSGGLTSHNKIFSLSYDNLMSLCMIYRNNGWVYSGYRAEDLNSGVPVVGLSIYIYYDGFIYIGSFDSFKITENAEKPFTLDYDFDFTVRYFLPLVDSVGESSLQGAI